MKPNFIKLIATFFSFACSAVFAQQSCDQHLSKFEAENLEWARKYYNQPNERRETVQLAREIMSNYRGMTNDLRGEGKNVSDQVRSASQAQRQSILRELMNNVKDAQDAGGFGEEPRARYLLCMGQAGATNTQNQNSNIRTQDRFGALALATGRGNLYGWAYDFPSQDAANRRVLDECNQFGTGNCTVVMEFRNACASYAIDSARSSTAYGWAASADKGAADTEALRQCNNRGGYGSQCMIRVWGCTTR